jgi:hypothetical protein
MVIFNFKAFLSLIGGGVAAASALSFGLSRTISLFFALGVAAAVDLYIRYKSEDVSGALIHRDAGGHLWFVPMWICSIVVAGIAIAMYTGIIR